MLGSLPTNFFSCVKTFSASGLSFASRNPTKARCAEGYFFVTIRNASTTPKGFFQISKRDTCTIKGTSLGMP